jgi:hypothetical protein
LVIGRSLDICRCGPRACVRSSPSSRATAGTCACGVNPPAVAAVYNWGGVYFGFNLGFGFGTSNWSDPLNLSGIGSTGNFNLTGFLVGPTPSGLLL